MDLQIAINKCGILSTVNSELLPDYTINDIDIPILNNFKDLGIIFNSKLNFNKHIFTIVRNAKRTSNFILRCFITKEYINYIIAFKSYVRPLLEYAFTLWNPHRCGSNNNEMIEKVQQNYTKRVFYICNLPILNYETKLHFLKLTTLTHRRLIAYLSLDYKLINNLLDVDVSSFINTYLNSNRGPRIKIRMDTCKSNRTANYFGNRVANVWNSLPPYITNSPNFILFTNRLRRYYTNKSR